MSSIEVYCGHTFKPEQGQAEVDLLSASTDSEGRWTSGGELLGRHRVTVDRRNHNRPVFDQPGRGRLQHLSCLTCHREVWRRGLKLGRDFDAFTAAGLIRVDLYVLEQRVSRVR